jgi:formyltetrahydrofolate synthetase
MKKLGFLFVAVVLGTTLSMAQPQGPRNPEDMAKRQTEQIKEAVGLNSDQEKKVYDLNLEMSKKMQAMFQENQGGDREAMREKMTALREDQNKKMKEILTDEQWGKYEKYLEERRSRFGGGPGGGQ